MYFFIFSNLNLGGGLKVPLRYFWGKQKLRVFGQFKINFKNSKDQFHCVNANGEIDFVIVCIMSIAGKK
jgi:hypothetical protein